jgi:alcohol dehydrogenase
MPPSRCRRCRSRAWSAGSARPDRDFPLILDLHRRGHLPIDRLISHRLSLDEAGAAMDLVRSGDATRVILELA